MRPATPERMDNALPEILTVSKARFEEEEVKWKLARARKKPATMPT